jgi:hypothetical protein
LTEILIDYQNKRIRLTEERRSHILQHSEVRELEAEFGKVLKTPEFVVQSRTDDNVNLYYRYYLKTQVGDKWLCVVVKDIVDDSFILTAYLTDKIKTGEIIWQKQ